MQFSKAIMTMPKLLLLVLLVNTIIAVSTGFTLELIHPISSQPSLFERLVSRSNLRANCIAKNTTFHQECLDIARPLVQMQDYVFIVKVGMGTFKSQPSFNYYYFDMDTGSSLTWMQCEGCTQCFAQIPSPFPSSKSSSFQPILQAGNRKPYTYKIGYGDGSSSSGIYATETIYVNSDKGVTKRFPSFVFGCGLVNKMEYGEFKNNKIAGVMGLGWGENSFVNQIKESNGRFSYCLPHVNSLLTNQTRPTTYLRFGDDIVEQRNKAISTDLIKANNLYYVGLQDISINQKRLNISQGVFDGPIGKKGGCIIDSGTSYSHIIEPAYTKLRQGLEEYFSRNKNLKRVVIEHEDLCYARRKPEGFKNLPVISFHFKGSKDGFHLRPEAGFEVSKIRSLWGSSERFCLAMLPSKDETIIGAHQQTNKRIIYDTRMKKFIFYPEDCSKNS